MGRRRTEPHLTAAEKRDLETIDREIKEQFQRELAESLAKREAEYAVSRRVMHENWERRMLTPEIALGLAALERASAPFAGDPNVRAALAWIAIQRDDQARNDASSREFLAQERRWHEEVNQLKVEALKRRDG